MNRTQLCNDPGNLTNKNSFSASGLCNTRAIGLSEKDGAVAMTIKRVANASKPASATHTVTMKKDCRRLTKAAVKTAAKYRPDMQEAAARRISAIHKSLRVQKAASK